MVRASKFLPSSPGVSAAADPNLEYALGYARTLWVVYTQSTDKCGRTFVAAVEESLSEPMFDAQTTGTRGAMGVCSVISESGGRPSQYVAEIARRSRIGENDWSYHELEVLAQILEDAACHDQLDFGGTCSLRL